MAYYGGRGDYYRGDYYRGDLKGFLKKGFGLIRKVAPILKKGARFVPGVGTAVALADVGVSLVQKRKAAVTQIPSLGPIGSGFEMGTQGGGFGPTGGGGFGRRSKRMNPANPKALRRALRRVSGFAKLAQRTKRDIGKAATAAGVRRGSAGPKRKR